MRSWHPWLHFRTITRHKLLVMKYCFRIGLYKQGLLHDLSKYSPTEFLVGCKYYQGTRSPNNAEREATGVSMSWLHHKGRNRHHFEHWVDYSLDGEHVIMGARMPRKYVAEMVMDRISASRNYLGEEYTYHEPLQYFLKSKEKLWFLVVSWLLSRKFRVVDIFFTPSYTEFFLIIFVIKELHRGVTLYIFRLRVLG